jgi:hypothetical protein
MIVPAVVQITALGRNIRHETLDYWVRALHLFLFPFDGFSFARLDVGIDFANVSRRAWHSSSSFEISSGVARLQLSRAVWNGNWIVASRVPAESLGCYVIAADSRSSEPFDVCPNMTGGIGGGILVRVPIKAGMSLRGYPAE